MIAPNRTQELAEEQKRQRANEAAVEITGLSRERATREHFSGHDYGFVMFYADEQHMAEVKKWTAETFPEVPSLLARLLEAFNAKNDAQDLLEEVKQLPAPALIHFHGMLSEKNLGVTWQDFCKYIHPHLVQNILDVYGCRVGVRGFSPISVGDESGLKWTTTRGDKQTPNERPVEKPIPTIRKLEE